MPCCLPHGQQASSCQAVRSQCVPHAGCRADKNCLYGVNGYWEVFNFSVVTQQTIGCGR